MLRNPASIPPPISRCASHPRINHPVYLTIVEKSSFSSALESGCFNAMHRIKGTFHVFPRGARHVMSRIVFRWDARSKWMRIDAVVLENADNEIHVDG